MSNNDLTRLKEIEQRQDRLDQALRQAGVPLRVKLIEILRMLRQRKAGYLGDPTIFQQTSFWCDLFDAIEGLRPEQGRLSSGFVTRTISAVDEARWRLLHNPHDLYARNQLAYVERSLIRAMQ